MLYHRSAAYASLHKYQDALHDAKKNVELKPARIAKRKEVQRNPNSMSPHISNPRMMQALGLLLGVNIQTAFKIATWQ
ncbi:unnamed protein product [Sphagnum tenellum]